MTEPTYCPSCRAELPPDAPAGLCPKCLLRGGFPSAGRPDPAPTAAGPTASGFVPPSPAELARYFPQLEILELLGRGGMGAVYKARQASLDRIVALKILPPETGRDLAFADRFMREARALARLNHPHIVAIYESGEAQGLFYFMMEYVDGVNLRQAMHAGGVTAAQALAIVPQVCDALQYAHDEGVVHRDVKPENILLDKNGRVKIVDFGLSKLLSHDVLEPVLTATHQVMGTLRYMAPEQLEGTRSVDHRADIYSLGVVFYELLTGELPIGRFTPPSKKVQIDVRLDEVVLRALEKEPALRYQHAGDVRTAIEETDRVAESGSRTANSSAYRGSLLVVAAAVYATSFFLPAYWHQAAMVTGGRSTDTYTSGKAMLGWECFVNAWEQSYPCWYANPALWLSAIVLACGFWRRASLLGIVAIVLALTVYGSRPVFIHGYWWWLGSMTLMTGGAAYGWWRFDGDELRRKVDALLKRPTRSSIVSRDGAIKTTGGPTPT